MSLNSPDASAFYIGPPVDKRIPIPKGTGIESQNPVIRLLSDYGAVNFETIAKSPDIQNLSSPEKELLIDAFVGKVTETFFTGNFGDLRGAATVMNQLEISLDFPDDFYNEIGRLLPRISEHDLTQLVLTQPSSLGEYNLEGAKSILQRIGFSGDELSEKNIIKILNYRNILIALKERQLDAHLFKDSVQKLLTSGSI
jgi:hypothetical protein